MKGNSPLYSSYASGDESSLEVQKNTNLSIMSNGHEDQKETNGSSPKTLKTKANKWMSSKNLSPTEYKNQLLKQNNISQKGINIIKYSTNKKFMGVIANTYRKRIGQIGDGSAMAAISNEVRTKKLTNGVPHTQKGIQTIRSLSKMLRTNKLSKFETVMAKVTIKRIRNAMKGKYNGK